MYFQESFTRGKIEQQSIDSEGRSLPLVFNTMSSSHVGSAAACCRGTDPAREPDSDQDDGDWFEIGGEDNYSAVSAGMPAASVTAAAASAPSESRGVPAFNFSFAMGGWLMFYSFGVAKCLMDHGLHKVLPMRQRAIGSSAGSLAATALVLEADIDKVRASLCNPLLLDEPQQLLSCRT